MKFKFGVLALASLLLSASAFAEEGTKDATAVQVPTKGSVMVQPKGLLTIQVAGRTIATISLAEQPKDAKLLLSCERGIVYDQEKGIATAKGKFTFEITQDGKSLIRIAVEDGVAIVDLGASAPTATSTVATPLSFPGEDPGGFCGQSEVARMVMNTPTWKEMQRQQREEALRQSKERSAAPMQTPIQPQQSSATMPQK